jgi:hypothetical protein
VTRSKLAAEAGDRKEVTKTDQDQNLATAIEVDKNNMQGCQICLGSKYQSGEKCTKFPKSVPNGHTIFPVAVK